MSGEGTCDWCGLEAIDEVVIQPAQYTGSGHTRRLRKMALMAKVCEKHKNILAEQPKFYTCGCYYAGDFRCPMHGTKLRKMNI